MKTNNNNTNTFNAKHSHCKLCPIENYCNVCKHYKTLKDKNLEDASVLLCYVANLDHCAIMIYEELKSKKNNNLNEFSKIIYELYGNAFAVLWRRYNEHDRENSTENERRAMHIYIYDVLDKYNLVAFFEAKLGINLTTQYNNYFVDMAIEEYKKYEKQL